LPNISNLSSVFRSLSVAVACITRTWRRAAAVVISDSVVSACSMC